MRDPASSTPWPRSRPIEDRLREAGLAPLPRTAWLEIDLDALRENLAVMREVVGPGVRVEPVVKADAYGHGAVPVARALEAADADGLSVATLDEAYELREAGISLPLLVIYPAPPDRVAAAARAGIAVSIGAGRLLDRVLDAAARAVAEDPGGPSLEIHVEIETGLGRGGAMPDEVASAIRRVAASPGVRLGGIWTHLAAADVPSNALAQDERFGRALDPTLGAVRYGSDPEAVRRHLAGSGGVLGGDVALWDAVRVGLSIYGLVPDTLVLPASIATTATRLRPVMALKGRAVRVADLPAGHGVSYGPTFVTARPSRIATLPVGYADGWRRFLSDRSEGLVRGVRVPLVGRVAMDAVMLDVTDVPGPPVDEDDEFVLLGEQAGDRITALELAATGGTISYEILAGMSRRLPRVYHAAGLPVEVRTLAGGRSEWHASSSGMATSATSRSMPS
ncbi:MAG TPA: alanine racemase [Candidatus Limnocylindrales bacterium]